MVFLDQKPDNLVRDPETDLFKPVDHGLTQPITAEQKEDRLHGYTEGEPGFKLGVLWLAAVLVSAHTAGLSQNL